MGEKKIVRLMLGDGPDRIEIGEAYVEIMPDNTWQVDVVVTNAEQLGANKGTGFSFRGTLPALPWKDV